MTTVAVYQWQRFNANGEWVDVKWRATLEKIESVRGGTGRVKPGTAAEQIDAALVDEQGYVRSEFERAQRTQPRP